MSHDAVVLLGAIIYGASNLAGTVYAARKASGAKNIARDVKASVGDVNGQTLLELAHTNRDTLNHLVSLDKYQHRRNHDIMTLQHGNALRLYLIAKHFGIEMPEPPKLDLTTEGETDAI